MPKENKDELILFQVATNADIPSEYQSIILKLPFLKKCHAF